MESRFRNRNRPLMESESESKLLFHAGIGIGIGIELQSAESESELESKVPESSHLCLLYVYYTLPLSRGVILLVTMTSNWKHRETITLKSAYPFLFVHVLTKKGVEQFWCTSLSMFAIEWHCCFPIWRIIKSRKGRSCHLLTMIWMYPLGVARYIRPSWKLNPANNTYLKLLFNFKVKVAL